MQLRLEASTEKLAIGKRALWSFPCTTNAQLCETRVERNNINAISKSRRLELLRRQGVHNTRHTRFKFGQTVGIATPPPPEMAPQTLATDQPRWGRIRPARAHARQ